MAKHDLTAKLAILADAAKYDASCASSGSTKRGSAGETKGIGSITGSGICHSYAPDGRCISLLKILLTNHCVYDCLYCVNRVSSNVARARFTPEEVVKITLDFYKRNYIEGLFLSSGIIRSPNYTMEQLVQVARLLRETHHYRGYIHLKTIPDADPYLIEQAGLYADRLSINVELPREQSLSKLAPQKQAGSIRKAMGGLRLRLEEAEDDRKRMRHAKRFAPAGQSTQMIVGADGESDLDIIRSSVSLYSGYKLKRVYYSAYSPIPGSSQNLPAKKPPLMREHRLYQADWLLSTVWVWAAFQGLGQGGLIAVALTVIVLRSPDAVTAARMSSMAQSVGYTTAAFGPLVMGLIFTSTGHPEDTLWLVVPLGLGVALAGWGAGRDKMLRPR